MKFTELKIRKAIVKDHLPNNIHPLLRRIYLNRGIGTVSELERSTKFLLSFNNLQGIHDAVQLLTEAIYNNIRIMVVGDFDVDGATSIALTMLALKSMGAVHVKYFVPNRFKDGYGLSQAIVNKIYLDGAKIILTVDNGISSYDAIKQARKYGMIVIITDHHLPKNKLPEANAIVNPNIMNDKYKKDYSSLAGVGVAFYLMLALRAHLRSQGWFQINCSEPNLTELLDLVAIGTIVDVAPLDKNNRILVFQGINRIRAGKCRPGIIALLEIAKCKIQHLVAKDISFILGPRLNAAGRIEDMSLGVSLLLTNDLNHARSIANHLDYLNQKRKKIEKNMQSDALIFCQKLKTEHHHLPIGLTLYNSQWHQGITGILASKLKDDLNRPVIVFALSPDGTLKGSGRSIPKLHLLNLLENLHVKHPDLMITFGGHAMAAGISLLNEIQYKKFSKYFDKLATQYINNTMLKNIIWSDGELQPIEFSLHIAELLRNSGPWGQSFPEPIFNGRFKLQKQYIISDKHLKVIVIPINGGPIINGIFFNADMNFWPNNKIYIIDMVFKLNINQFANNEVIQLLIEHIWPCQKNNF